MADPSGPKPDPSGIRSASLLLAIPTLLIVSPLVGFFVGRAADRWLQTTPWLSLVGVFLGFAAAGRETWMIVRRAQSEEKD
jgi:F0F1-type ATP synthase assembly protein I